MDIVEQVKAVVSAQLDVDQAAIQETDSFVDDLEADSLAIVELVLALEETFGITIDDEDTEKIQTLRDAIEYIKARKG